MLYKCLSCDSNSVNIAISDVRYEHLCYIKFDPYNVQVYYLATLAVCLIIKWGGVNDLCHSVFVRRLYQPSSRRPVAFSPTDEMGLTDIETCHALDVDEPFFDDRQCEMVYEVSGRLTRKCAWRKEIQLILIQYLSLRIFLHEERTDTLSKRMDIYLVL